MLAHGGKLGGRFARPQRRPEQRRGSLATLGLYSDLLPSPTRPFGEQTVLFQDLCSIGRKHGVDVVVLTPGYVAHERGWTWNGSSWVEQAMPMPDVIVRRSGTFTTRHSVVERDLTVFRRAGRLHTLPRICGNKWTVLSLFKSAMVLRSHVPDTRLVRSFEDVWRGLQDVSDAYVKPLAGAQGISIYHLTKGRSGIRARYERRKLPRKTERLTQHFDPGTIVEDRQFPDRESFTRFWKGVGMKSCLLQETIHLPKLPDGRPFDFRWLVQFLDEPVIVARVARVGRSGAVTTNIHTGGTAMPAEQALKSAKVRDVDEVMATLDGVAMAAAEQLRERYGPYAEVGIDLALRPDNSVVIFEVNPTPGRRMLRALGETSRQMSLEYLVEYAIRANRRTR